MKTSLSFAPSRRARDPLTLAEMILLPASFENLMMCLLKVEAPCLSKTIKMLKCTSYHALEAQSRLGPLDHSKAKVIGLKEHG